MIKALLVEKDPQVAQLLLLRLSAFDLVRAEGAAGMRRALAENPGIRVVVLGAGLFALFEPGDSAARDLARRLVRAARPAAPRERTRGRHVLA